MDVSVPVLVVDDNEGMRRTMCTLLTRLGFYDVDETPTAAGALAMLHTREYGLVICDWYLGTANGSDLLHIVRANRHLRNLRFILVSGEPRAQNVLAASHLHADSFILKPFRLQTLKEKIRAVFDQRPTDYERLYVAF